MRTILFGACCLLLILSGFQSQAQNQAQNLRKIKWLNGEWTGVGYQKAMKAEWDVLLQCNTDKGEINITYPSISCKGVWELKYTDGCRAEFMEIIKEEQDNCGDVVRVIVTRIDERFVSVAFFIPEIDDVVAAYTVLTRVEASDEKETEK